MTMEMDKAWKDTGSVLLGGEVPALERVEAYLCRDAPAFHGVPSAKSGQPVFISDEYPEGARFVSLEEVPETISTPAALDLNSIKDIDSIQAALGESLIYTGNIAKGQCQQVGQSNRVFDSQNVFRSEEVFFSKNIGYCHIVKYSENIFGSQSVGKDTRFCIKGYEVYNSVRMLETIIGYSSADLYYCANMENCADCLFSFNQRGARQMIGNLKLAPDKFKALKTKLVGEMRETLLEKRKLPSILTIVQEGMA